MIDHATSLAALGPGLGGRSGNRIDLREFARRRVDHLKVKLARGELKERVLRERLTTLFGENSNKAVDGKGKVDLESLWQVIVAQQAKNLQARLDVLFGEKAAAIVAPDGRIDQDKLEHLVEGQSTKALHARLVEQFGDRDIEIVDAEGAIDVCSFRALLQPAPPHSSSRP
ncbi:MAG: hypothetical protein ACR2Q4_13795 [Geminicoccaceae bacterium]